MDNNQNPKGGQAADKEETPARKSARKRNAIGAANASILDFIMCSTPYECDAIRVVINAMREKHEAEQLTFDETTILNRYMNEGLVKGDNISVHTVRKHRQKMAGRLLKPLSDFLEKKGDVAVAAALLSEFAGDDNLVDQNVSILQSSGNPPVNK